MRLASGARRHFPDLPRHFVRLIHILADARNAEETADPTGVRTICAGESCARATYWFDPGLGDDKSNAERLRSADRMARPRRPQTPRQGCTACS